MLTLRPGTIYFNKLQGNLNLVLSVKPTPREYNLMVLRNNGQLISIDTDSLIIDNSSKSSNWKILN
jgi:hypothetical protein